VLPSFLPSRLRPTRPLVATFASLTAALVVVVLWRRAVSELLAASVVPVLRSGGLLVDVPVTDGPFVVGVVAFAGAYTVAHDLWGGRELPSASDAASAVLAVAVPLVTVGLTTLVGVLDGVPYGSLTKTAYAADAPVWPVVVATDLGLLVGVPVVVAVCQILVQGSVQRDVDGDAALVVTVDTTGRLTPVPDAGKLAALVAFSRLLGLGLYGREPVAVEWARDLASLPAALFVCVVFLAGLVGIDSVTGGLFALAQLATFGVAAYAYDWSGSLLPPALAYACLRVANTACVYGSEAGVQYW
jgi:hypothetical protein